MSTHYITTTQLREQSSKVVASLLAGEDITLIHRSKMIGKIIPRQEPVKVLTKEDIKKLKQIIRQMNLPKLSYKQRDRAYRKHLMEKYGKSISG